MALDVVVVVGVVVRVGVVVDSQDGQYICKPFGSSSSAGPKLFIVEVLRSTRSNDLSE